MKTVERKKGKLDRIRALAVKETAAHFDCDPSHVRKIDDGTRDNDEIKAFYRNLYKNLSDALNAATA